jgi:cardiolipin synthase
LLLTPVFAAAVLSRRFGTALAVCAAAGLTDALDGFLARRWRSVSRFGAYVDPIADKALLVTAYVCLWWVGAAPAWLLWLVLGRDALILVMAAAALAFTAIRDFPPSAWGKISTIVQVSTACAILVSEWMRVPPLAVLARACMFATAALAVVSGIHYVAIALRKVRGQRAVS